MHLDYLYDLVRNEAETKLDRILALCDSEIEKRFIGHFYCFFIRHGKYPQLKFIEPAGLKLLKGVNRKGRPTARTFYEITNHQGITKEFSKEYTRIHEYADPATQEPVLLIGFRVGCGTVCYDVLPQFPVYDQSQERYIDIAIQMIDPNTEKVLGNFAIECDGFEWHHTLPQLNADNIRGRFLTKNDFKVIRYTGSEINKITDQTILDLENTMFNSVFRKDSAFYNFYRLCIASE